MLAELTYHMPVFSAVLLLVTGILIGYALWLPLRGDTEGISESLQELGEQNEQLQTALREQRDAYAALERKYSAQEEEWTQLRVSSQRIEQAWDQHQREHLELGQGLHALQGIKEQAQQEISSERQLRVEVETNLRETQRRLQAAEAEAARGREQLNELKLRFDEAHESVRSREQQLQELTRATSQQADQSVAEHEKQIADLNATLDQQRGQLEDVRAEKDNALTRLANERLQREALEQHLEQHEEEARKHRGQSQAQQQLQQRVSQLQQALEQTKVQLAQAVSERESATESHEQTSVLLTALERDLVCHQQTIETIQRQRDQFRGELEAAKQQCGELQEHLQAAQQTATRQNDETQEELDQLRDAFRTLRASAAEKEDRLQTLKIECDDAQAAAVESRQQQQQLAERVQQAQREADKLRTQREELLASLQTAREEAENLQKELKTEKRSARIAEERVMTLQPLQEELAALIDQHHRTTQVAREAEQERDEAMSAVLQAQDMISSLRMELNKQSEGIAAQQRDASEAARIRTAHHEALDTIERHEATISDLREELTAQVETIASLTREREQVLARLRRQNVMLQSRVEHDHSGPRLAAETMPSSTARVDLRRGLVYTSRPERVDDLKKISGVAAVLEQKLNDLGIYTYKQIMEWGPDQVAEFSQLLSFRDRIKREDWIGQARRLFAEHYGEAA